MTEEAPGRRDELEPSPRVIEAAELDRQPETPVQRRADDPQVQKSIDDMIEHVAGGPVDRFQGRLIRELITAGLKLIPDGRDTGELKLMNAAVKELRYAFRVFGAYQDSPKVTIFGSARTPEDHPDYHAAVDFGRIMAESGWMSITGAGDGIMKAGHVGPGKAASFGVAIRLPFETTANTIIAGDEKLIHFRYFFTRKLIFLFHAEAVALFPGGFGTMDEAYETLTLIQTGKASMIPIVLVEGQSGYWESFQRFVVSGLLERGFISPEDQNLYAICHSPEEAAAHIHKFYRRYHSSRYIRDTLVLRTKSPLSQAELDLLNQEFAVLIKSGSIQQYCGPKNEEGDDYPELYRLSFHHTRRAFGLVRSLIDRINDFPGASS